MKSKEINNETAGERKRRYVLKAQQKEKRLREERRRARIEGRTGERVLAFLSDIFAAVGLNQSMFAKALSTTQQGVNYMFLVDDIRLSKAIDGLAYFGYTLSVRLEPTRSLTPGVINNTVNYRLEGVEPSNSPVRLPAYVDNLIMAGGRMSFLCEAIASSGRSVGAICVQAGIDVSSFRFFIEKDDMRVRYLYALQKP